MAYIKDTANQDEEVTGETDGWKGRKDRWRVEGEQSASIDWVNWHDIPRGSDEGKGREKYSSAPTQLKETQVAQPSECSNAKASLHIPE